MKRGCGGSVKNGVEELAGQRGCFYVARRSTSRKDIDDVGAAMAVGATPSHPVLGSRGVRGRRVHARLRPSR